MYRGKEGLATVILKAVADFDLWIWHAHFGLPGSLNDINVLDRSDLFANLAAGRTPSVSYNINGHEYNMGYYLADGIYPKWATLVQSISMVDERKEKHFNTMQEAVRKDVERAFGVLKSRYAIIEQPAKRWNTETLTIIMKACIILHNMNVEDKRGQAVNYIYDDEATRSEMERHNISRKRIRLDSNESNDAHNVPTSTADEPTLNNDTAFENYTQRYEQIRDTQTHYQLKNDLIDHLWELHGKA